MSIRNSIRAAREGARSIREVIGHDIWEATNELYLLFMSESAAAQYLQDRDEVYKNIRRSTQLCLGLIRSTMMHDEPMDFLWLGVMLERRGHGPVRIGQGQPQLHAVQRCVMVLR